jgi:hypothetical protein
MSIEAILTSIFAKLPHLHKPTQKFLRQLFAALIGRQGRANFTNMSRYATIAPISFRRHFGNTFDWLGFNRASIDFAAGTYIGVFDCSFIPKAGQKTFGLATFWSSCAGKAQQGLEISVLACVNVATKACFALEATQTPPNLAKAGPRSVTDKVTDQAYTRLSFYLEQLSDCLPALPELTYWVGDGFYAKTAVFDLLQAHKRHLITRLRHDADLYHLWTKGRQPGQRGPTRLYDGKVSFTEMSRWVNAGQHPDHEHITLYTLPAYAKRFGRRLRVVLLLNTRTQQYVLLASSDVTQSASATAHWYCLRFQIELLFRDAKMFCGLTHCQARSDAKLDYHFNASLSGVNLARLVLAADATLGGSMNALVRRQTGERIWSVIYEQLSPQSRLEVIKPDASCWQFWARKAA